jgi:phosphoribosyl-ATP pyrophosphohydrolase/phosphoribosyl-AMP cyclohydrolase
MLLRVALLKFDRAGLIPAVAQDRLTGEVRTVVWMNREALQRTLQTGLVVACGAAPDEVSEDGAARENVMAVHRIIAGCDGTSLLLLVDPSGPSCQSGEVNCFFEVLDANGDTKEATQPAAPFLSELEQVIAARTRSDAQKSYTRSLLEAGAPKIGAKLREEAAELSQAISAETPERVASEAADVIYHLLVALRARGVSLRKVIEVLANRAGVSGLEEKAGRRRS